MDSNIEKLFLEIEAAFINAIKSLHIKNEVYACGLWLFYCDYTVINPPCFGYNSSYDEKDDKWAPPEWDVDVDDTVYDALSPLYEKLSKLMEGKADQDWEELIEYQWEFYSKLCYKLNSVIESKASPFINWPKSSDFVIGIFEEREDEEIYKKLVINSLGSAKAKDLCVI